MSLDSYVAEKGFWNELITRALKCAQGDAGFKRFYNKLKIKWKAVYTRFVA